MNVACAEKLPLKAVVIGFGNPLAGDDAAGIAVIRELKQRNLPPEVELIDGGTKGIFVLDALPKAEKLIIVDAIQASADIPYESGTIVEIDKDKLQGWRHHLVSAHGIGLNEALSLLSVQDPSSVPNEMIIFGIIVPEVECWRIGLSSPAARACQQLADRIYEMIKSEPTHDN